MTTNSANTNRHVYESVNEVVLSLVPTNAKRVLDVGCGSGGLGKAIKRRQAAVVTGITYSPQESELAKQHLDEVIVGDLNTFDFKGLGAFDCVICSHVLEHLNWPDVLLHKLRACTTKDSRLLVALPNVLAWRQRLQFTLGKFQYSDTGLMDRTHFRFFDYKSVRRLVEDSGFVVVSTRYEGVLPFSRLLPPFQNALNLVATRLSPGLFAQQFVFLAARNA